VTEPRWLSPAQARAWLGYRRMRALLDLQVSRDLAKDSGLSDADYDVLSNVSESPGHSMRLGDLAARMLWSKSRLSHHVARMERRGLVARRDCPSDGRGAILTLTEAGWHAVTTAAPAHVDSVRRHFVDLLTSEQIQVLGDLTETVLAHLSTVQAAPGAGRHRPEEPGAGRPGPGEPGASLRGPDEPDSRHGATASLDMAEQS
jgi:DNA-binding MarR family transcriptional regulator